MVGCITCSTKPLMSIGSPRTEKSHNFLMPPLLPILTCTVCLLEPSRKKSSTISPNTGALFVLCFVVIYLPLHHTILLLCRQRGYNVGSLMSKAGEADKYYKQPGHPLSDLAEKGGRFRVS